MKIGPFRVNLAEGTKVDTSGTERGSSAKGTDSLMYDGEIDVSYDKLKPTHFATMRQIDGTVSAMYNVLTMPIVANPWSIKPEDDSPEAQAQADFVRDCLTRPPHKGGMSTPFQLVLKDMLRALLEGFRVYEKVFELRDGKVVYKKIGTRDTSTIVIKVDSKGGFNGFKQEIWDGNKNVEVTIPLQYAFLFTANKEHHHIKGESMFRAAYTHYDKKQKLYYLAQLAAQAAAVAPKTVKAPANAKQEELDAYTANAAAMAVNSVIGLQDGWDLNTLDSNKGRFDLMPLIEHHNAEMARSILAQFMMLGTGSNVGSWALSQDQSDMFVLALRSVMSDIEEHISSYLIPDLIDYNFATKRYPTFEFANITDATVSFLKEVSLKLLDKRPESMPEDLVKGIQKKIADHFEIEITEPSEADKKKAEDAGATSASAAVGEIQKQALNGAQIASLMAVVDAVVAGTMPIETAKETLRASFPTMTDETIGKILDPATSFTSSATVTNSRTSKVMSKLSRQGRLADAQWRRDLTPAETKVNLAAIQQKYNTLEADFTAKAQEMFTGLEEQIKTDLEALLKDGKIDDVADYTVSAPEGYEKLVLDKMVEAYNYAKVGASDELDVDSPATPANTKELIKQKAMDVVKKQMDDLTFEVKNAVTEAARKNQLSVKLSLADLLTKVGGIVSIFSTDKLGLTASVIVGSAINMGRDDVFVSAKEELDSYQYSAILDEVTCATCEDLDGSVVSEEEYRSTEWLPPIHFNCRCIWVAIKKTEEDRPEVTGFPDTPGGREQADLSNNPSKLAVKLEKTEEELAELRQAFKLAFTDKIVKEITNED